MTTQVYGTQRDYMLKSREGGPCGNKSKLALSTASNLTLTAQQTAIPILERDTNGASRTDTTATAAQLVAYTTKNAFLYEEGWTWDTYIFNTSTTANRILTISAGSGITFIGEGVIAGTTFDLNPNRGVQIIWRITNNVSGSEAITAYITGVTASGGLAEVLNITSATVLTAANSGQLIALGANSGAVAVTLPAPVAGLRFRFQVTGALTGAVTITSTGANISGVVADADGTACGGTGFTTGVFASKTNLIVGTGGVIGDWYEFSAFGAAYTVVGITGLHTSITAT
jgi:hypothetical protein